MKCYKCHHIIENDAKFCEYCGSEQGFSHGLIQKAMDGDVFSQQELYKRTYNNVYMIISSLVKDEDISHDLVQDTYIKAYSKLGQLQNPNKFRPWIKRISHNLAVDYLRKNKEVIFTDLESNDTDFVYDIEDESLDNVPDVYLSKDKTSRILRCVLDSLPDS